MNRIIKNGKLELVGELIGGPADGTLCSGQCGTVRIPVSKEREFLISDDSPAIIPQPIESFHLYKRVSQEKLIYEGEENGRTNTNKVKS